MPEETFGNHEKSEETEEKKQRVLFQNRKKSGKIQENYEKSKETLKKNIENTKISVKHKILAKLAGKDFKLYMESIPSDTIDKNSSARPSKPELPLERSSSESEIEDLSKENPRNIILDYAES